MYILFYLYKTRTIHLPSEGLVAMGCVLFLDCIASFFIWTLISIFSFWVLRILFGI